MKHLLRSHPAIAALAFLVIHMAVWTSYGVLSNGGPLHPDMLEAYLWGQEYQLGYYKHPPLWAWLAGAWFEVFPRTNWAFYLLSTLSSGLAVIGIWQLYGLYVKGSSRLGATLLVFLTPFYTFMALKFNANSILLLLWPWTAYFFARSIEKLSLRSAVFFGVFAAAALLSKYYSALLLASCVAASFFHPNWRKYYLSPAPYLSVAICVLLVLPHIYWLITNDFPSVAYVKTRSEFASSTIYRSVLAFFLGCIGFNLLLAASILVSRRGQPENDAAPAVDPARLWFLGIVALGPFILSLLVGLIGHVRLSTNFAIPIFFLLPLFLTQLLRPQGERLQRLTVGAAGLLYISALPIAFAVPFVMFSLGKPLSKMPSLEVAQDATRIFHEVTGAPLLNVAGSFPYALVAAYYSGDKDQGIYGFRSPAGPLDYQKAACRKRPARDLRPARRSMQCARVIPLFAGFAKNRIGQNAAIWIVRG